MKYEHYWALLGLVWIFGWLAFHLVRRWLDGRRELRQREMAHRERLVALEKGQAIPEVLELGDETGMPAMRAERWRSLRVAGVVLSAGGLGLLLAFALSGDAELVGLWSLGLLPLLLGLGLLLAAQLDRA